MILTAIFAILGAVVVIGVVLHDQIRRTEEQERQDLIDKMRKDGLI